MTDSVKRLIFPDKRKNLSRHMSFFIELNTQLSYFTQRQNNFWESVQHLLLDVSLKNVSDGGRLIKFLLFITFLDFFLFLRVIHIELKRDELKNVINSGSQRER